MTASAVAPTTMVPQHHLRQPPPSLVIDGVEFVRADSVKPVGPSEWRIVIAQRGWVFVGRFEQNGEEITLHDASTIRTWGTTKGLGQLALEGKQTGTKLDKAGTVKLHVLGVVATFDTAHTSW